MDEGIYKRYMLAVLLVLLAFNHVDRLALGLLLQDIKIDLLLTDTQLGLLTGIAFALFYSVMGIPIARWADRGNRVTIISLTAVLSSIAVVLCGMAGSFLQLLLIRIGVAVGDAGSVPPAHSLIADYFNRAQRPKAVAIYKLGLSLSLVVGYFGAGWLNQLYGWRVTFMLLGLPGLGLAVVAWLTLKEPRLEKPSGIASQPPLIALSFAHQPSVKEVFVTLWGNTTFRHLLFGYSVVSFFGSGILQWKSAFFIRSYGLQTGELGTWFAAIYGVGGFLGTYLGGVLATRYAPQNERLQLTVTAMMYCSYVGVSTCLYLSPTPDMAFAMTGLGAVAGGMTVGPVFALIQTLVSDRMRAMSIAILLLFSNLIGLGLGPLIAGALSDAFRPWAGEESLRYSLLALGPGYFWAAWHFWRAGRTVTHDLAMAQMLAKV